MNTLKIQEFTITTTISRARKDGGNITIDRIENEAICGACDSYVDELEEGVYHCSACDSIIHI